MSKFNKGTTTRLMVGYVDSSDDKEFVGGGKHAQIEINARNGSVQPFAAITAYTSDGKDVVVAQIMETIVKDGQIMNTLLNKSSNLTSSDAGVDSFGNSHQVNCFEAK